MGRVGLYLQGTTFVKVLFTATLVAGMGEGLPLAIGTTVRVSFTAQVLQRVVVYLVVVQTTFLLLGVVVAAGHEL